MLLHNHSAMLLNHAVSIAGSVCYIGDSVYISGFTVAGSFTTPGFSMLSRMGDYGSVFLTVAGDSVVLFFLAVNEDSFMGAGSFS